MVPGGLSNGKISDELFEFVVRIVVCAILDSEIQSGFYNYLGQLYSYLERKLEPGVRETVKEGILQTRKL